MSTITAVRSRDPALDAHSTPPPAVALLIVTLIASLSLYMLARHPTPFEDAAMLLRYAQHLADGHGIVWNIGEPPVDGATDFLFLLMVSATVAAGVPLELAARGLSLVAHLSTVLLLLYGVPSLYRVPWWWGVFPAVHVGVGAALVYTSAHFGTPVFAAFAAGAWYCVLRYARDQTRASAWGFAALGLLCALTRPDGVLLVAAMLLGLGVAHRGLVSAPLRATALLFGTAGLAYFIWRWWYFGYPLPNPFYRKSLAFPEWKGFLFGVRSVVRMALPAAATLLLAGASPMARQRALLVGVPVAAYLTAWIAISREMNHMARYQYVAVLLLMLSAPGIVKAVLDALPRFASPPTAALKRATAVMLAAVAVAFCWHNYRAFGALGLPADGRETTGRALQAFGDRGYVLATTEAGLLPLYSTWRAIDAWGFNDAWIAHNEGLTSEYLDRHRPDVIMFLADFSPQVPAPRGDGEWFRLRDTLHQYARDRAYVLAAVWGQLPHRTHYYYVRRDNPDCQRLVDRLSADGYRWFQSGQIATNFAVASGHDERSACVTAGAP